MYSQILNSCFIEKRTCIHHFYWVSWNRSLPCVRKNISYINITPSWTADAAKTITSGWRWLVWSILSCELLLVSFYSGRPLQVLAQTGGRVPLHSLLLDGWVSFWFWPSAAWTQRALWRVFSFNSGFVLGSYKETQTIIYFTLLEPVILVPVAVTFGAKIPYLKHFQMSRILSFQGKGTVQRVGSGRN